MKDVHLAVRFLSLWLIIYLPFHQLHHLGRSVGNSDTKYHSNATTRFINDANGTKFSIFFSIFEIRFDFSF